MTPTTTPVTVPTPATPKQEIIEALMDEALENTFPASDVPVYGCLAQRQQQMGRSAR